MKKIIYLTMALLLLTQVFAYASTHVPEIAKEIRVYVYNIDESEEQIEKTARNEMEKQTKILRETMEVTKITHDFAKTEVKVKFEVPLDDTIDMEKIKEKLEKLDVYEAKLQEARIFGFELEKGAEKDYYVYLQNLKVTPATYEIKILHGEEFLVNNNEGVYNVSPNAVSDNFPVKFVLKLPNNFNSTKENLFTYSIKEIDTTQSGGMIDLKIGQETKFRIMEKVEVEEDNSNVAKIIICALLSLIVLIGGVTWYVGKKKIETAG